MIREFADKSVNKTVKEMAEKKVWTFSYSRSS